MRAGAVRRSSADDAGAARGGEPRSRPALGHHRAHCRSHAGGMEEPGVVHHAAAEAVKLLQEVDAVAEAAEGPEQRQVGGLAQDLRGGRALVRAAVIPPP